MAGSGALERLRFTVSFTSLKTYYACPRQFELKYISKPPMPWVFKPAMAIGGVVHKAIAQSLRLRRDRRPPEPIESHVDRYLRQEPYPVVGGDEIRAEHRPEIISHVECALDLLPPDAEILDVEENYRLPFRHAVSPRQLTLLSKVDLVIRHGPEGVIDHIDFKTGAYGGDDWQNAIARMTVAFERKLRGEQLRTVNILTKSGEYAVVPLSEKDKTHSWELIRHTVGGLATDTSWTARPDQWNCRICDFRSACSWAAQPDEHYES